MRIKYILPLLLIGLLIITTYFLYQKKDDRPISSKNSNEESIKNITIDFYSQSDARWSNNEIGNSKSTMSNTGCTVCCISMALSIKNIKMLPDELNEKLKLNAGYTTRGLILWDKITLATGFAIGPIKNTHDNIVRSLKAGNPVIAKVFLHGTVQHWVLIIGMNKGRYQIADPLGNNFSEKYLDKISDGIYSIRVFVSSN